MSLTEAQLRDEVIKAYSYLDKPNDIWRYKVLKMKYAQVFAIYIRLKREGTIK